MKMYEVWLYFGPLRPGWGAGDGHLIDIFQQVNSKDFLSRLPFIGLRSGHCLLFFF